MNEKEEYRRKIREWATSMGIPSVDVCARAGINEDGSRRIVFDVTLEDDERVHGFRTKRHPGRDPDEFMVITKRKLRHLKIKSTRIAWDEDREKR